MLETEFCANSRLLVRLPAVAAVPPLSHLKFTLAVGVKPNSQRN